MLTAGITMLLKQAADMALECFVMADVPEANCIQYCTLVVRTNVALSGAKIKF